MDVNLSDIRTVTETLRRESVDVYNRIHSIDEDARFVATVADAYGQYPLLPNLRCGAWYTDYRRASSQPVYFKSTDGHHGQWAFNLRRANLHLLSLIQEHGGVLLVDSTRRGKRIPDALSKTVPLWCAVVNAAIARQQDKVVAWEASGALFTPPTSVSTSEHTQMASLVASFADNLLASQYTLPALDKPLRPFWITPSTTVSLDHSTADYYAVICVSASKAIPDGIDRRAGYVYVQGSGDDHELWSQGLTPEMYWQHQRALLSAEREELSQLIRFLVTEGSRNSISAAPPASAVRQTGRRLWLSTLSAIPVELSVVRLGGQDLDAAQELHTATTSLNIPVPHAGKKGQFYFMNSLLPRSVLFIGSQLAQGRDVCVACSDGRDISVGVALAALQLFFDDQGSYTTSRRQATKEGIRLRLQWILESRPGANPSRTTLKRVHEFLMSPSTRAQRTKLSVSPGADARDQGQDEDE